MRSSKKKKSHAAQLFARRIFANLFRPDTPLIANRSIYVFLIILVQTSVYNWVQVHRVHHKYAETVKDPLDFRRGFFFAHVGWYCLSFHPACEREMKRIDMSDIRADKDIMFQYKWATNQKLISSAQIILIEFSA